MILTYKYRIKDRSVRKVLHRHACGASHDRDVNAASNIRAFALSAQGLAGESRQNANRHKRSWLCALTG